MTTDMRVLVDRQREAAAADAWNAAHPVGTPVVAYPGFRPEDVPNAPRIITSTRSRATVLGGHTAVVWVHGHSACITLSHIDVRTHGTSGELSEQRHWLHDADPDSTFPAIRADLTKHPLEAS